MTISAEQLHRDTADLLRRAAEGEEITITQAGTPVARLLPAPTARPPGVNPEATEAIRRIREFRKGRTLGPDLTIKQLINEGRR